MTIQELYESVAQLGFETELEDNNRFYYAVDRALLQVNRIRPATSIYKLNHFPLENRLTDDTFEPVIKDDEALVFVADNAKSYYFECNGNGLATIEKTADGETWETIKSIDLVSENGRFIEYKGLILDGEEQYLGTVRIKFSGDYVYYVQNVALYGGLLGVGAEKVPAYSKYIAYDLASLTDDFLSFVCPPIVDATRGKGFVLNDDYFVEGTSKILIPASTVGIFDVCYNRRITEVKASDDMETTIIDLDDDLAAVLPNLVASYIWVDDEPAKAEYYLTLYREQVAEIRAMKEPLSPVVYRNKNGW